MNKIKDSWFTQEDLINRINNHTHFSKEYTLIYESIDNAFEHLVYYPIPIPSKKIESRMIYETWGEDFRLTRKKVFLKNGKQYLSLSFRRHFKLSLLSRNYYSPSRVVFAKMLEDKNRWSRNQKCFVLTEALIEYLHSTNQVLLYGIRSHRCSERNINEFSIEKQGAKYRSSVKNYSMYVQAVQDRGSIYHKQIKTMSVLFGKYFVPFK